MGLLIHLGDIVQSFKFTKMNLNELLYSFSGKPIGAILEIFSQMLLVCLLIY